jgi:hypothetical protein
MNFREHLYRRHRVPIQCKRCWLRFKSQEDLDTHLTVLNICALTPGYPAEGLTPDLEKKLKCRKKASPEQTEEQRWKEIYRLLFPDEVVPNPCKLKEVHSCGTVSIHPRLSLYTTHRHGQMMLTIPDFEPVQENAQSPDSRAVADFEAFSRQQLPRYFRNYLEEAVNNETQHLEEHIRSHLVTIVRDCQDRMFSAYKIRSAKQNDDATQTPSSTCEDSFTAPPTSQGGSASSEKLESSFHQPMDVLNSSYQAPTPLNTLPYVPDMRNLTKLPAFSSDPAHTLSDSGYATTSDYVRASPRLYGFQSSGSDIPRYTPEISMQHPDQFSDWTNDNQDPFHINQDWVDENYETWAQNNVNG